MTTASTEWPLWSTRARLVVTNPRLLDRAVRIADRELARIDEACSRFRTDSELTRLAPLLPAGAPVSDTLAMLVRHALRAAELSDGDVDPTLGHAMDAVGYDRDIRLIGDSEGPVRAIASPGPGWRSVVLVGNRLTVPAHLALDLGATAKAVAGDLIVARISRELGCGVLLSLGGDIATAGAAPEGGWGVLVQDTPDDPAEIVHVPSRFAIATSSTQKRRWMRGDTTVHHILDPRTGEPARPVWRSASVIAPTCVQANTFSTAAIVRGGAALEWLERQHIAARLVASDGRVTETTAWPRELAAAS